MKSARVNPGVAPGSGVYLGLEQGEIEALHVALAAGVAQRLEIPAVPHLVLVRRFLRQVLAAASRRSQRHPRAKLFLGERSLAFPFSLSLEIFRRARKFSSLLENSTRQARRDSSRPTTVVACRLSIRKLKAHGEGADS